MARITVEDCLQHVDNQFDLVMTAAKRARSLANGADPLIETENDKPTVIALREIAAGLINDEILEQIIIPDEDLLSSEEAEELLASTPLRGQEGGEQATRAPTSEYRMATPEAPKAEPEVTLDSLFGTSGSTPASDDKAPDDESE